MEKRLSFIVDSFKISSRPNCTRMARVILFGGTGNLGKKIAEALLQKHHQVTAVVRNEAKAREIKHLVHQTVVADVTDASSLNNCCEGFEIVVSALGKSVSPNDRSKPSFTDVDLNANSAILAEAVKSGVKKFVYVSALHSENYLHLEYFRVHHEFSERLKRSGLNYSIVKPPALFSAFVDLIDMAKKGHLAVFGKGDKLTNPIYEGDLAAICVEAIDQLNAVVEAGGKEVLSRRQINEIIQNVVNPKKKVRTIPAGLIKAFLPATKLFSKNLYAKLAFFLEVMQEDTLAPKLGKMKLKEYIEAKVKMPGLGATGI